MPTTRFLLSAACCWLLLLSACDRPAPDALVADLVLTNGKIVTVDSLLPEAQAIAVKGDVILALGTSDAIAEYVGAGTEVIDLGGQLAIPGLIEGHAHFMGMGKSRMILDLRTASTWQDIVDMVGEAAEGSEPGEWIEGRGWHQEKWTEVPEGAVEGVPTHHSLSDVSPENPVLLRHASGHASFANAEAMRRGRVSPETPNPSGGEIVHDMSGAPTGMLRETAQGLVSRALATDRAQMTREELTEEARTQARLAAEESLMKGITSFQDAGSSFNDVDFFKQLVDDGELPLRLYVMIRASVAEATAKLPEYRTVNYGDDRLTVRALKRSLDGALGPHGAWLLKPYADMPESSGLATDNLNDLANLAQVALENDVQLNIHAIGDRANREVLDLYERTFAANTDTTDDLRWRVEHAQHLHPDDITRFAELGVIPAMQGVHATSDGPWIPRRLGDQRAKEGAYVWQTLWQSGAVIANGTDAPVEDVDPIASYYATVSRKLADGTVFYPEERLTREQALQSYTLNNAYAAFEEDIKGSLTPGKLADITVLSQDILTIPEDDILSTEVVYTIVGGEVMYARYGDG
ncbi:MAG: amidohydrolase [Bacteroidota bacterium]